MTAPAGADPLEIAKFDDLAHRFWDERGEFKPLHHLNPVRAQYVAEHAVLEARRVLDVGCGGGLLCEALTARGAQVTGIDLAPAMIEVAQLHAIEGALAIEYRCVPAETLLAEGRRYEVVTCMEMLEHVPDPAATLRTLAGLLAPGGQLFISTLNRNVRSFALAIVAAEYLTKLIPRGTHEYERFIRPSELARMARAAGLALRDLRGLHYDPYAGKARLTGDVAVNYLAHFSADPDA